MRLFVGLVAVPLIGLLMTAALACDAQPDGTEPGQDEPRIDPSLTPPPGAWEPEWRILVAFYNATGGPGWRNDENWLTDEPLDTWHGVSTNFGRVTVLSLPANGLTGVLPSELGGLSDLKELYLDVNQLTGEIPAELGNITNLTSLGLSRNQLTGEVPRELINLDSLELLDVRHNQLTGCVPGGRESFHFEGLPPCDPLLATQTPTPLASGPTASPPPTPSQETVATPPPTPGQGPTVTAVPTPRPTAIAVPTATPGATRPATAATPVQRSALTPAPGFTSTPSPTARSMPQPTVDADANGYDDTAARTHTGERRSRGCSTGDAGRQCEVDSLPRPAV